MIYIEVTKTGKLNKLNMVWEVVRRGYSLANSQTKYQIIVAGFVGLERWYINFTYIDKYKEETHGVQE